MFDHISPRRAIGLPILLPVSCFLNAVTKLWDMLIHLCLCKGHTGDTIVLDCKSSWLTITQLDFVLPVVVKCEHKNQITDKINRQNLSQWCHTSHRGSNQCVIQICMNDHHHAAFIHASHCITLCSDLVQMVKILKIAYDRLSRLRRRSWIWEGEEVGLYWTMISGWIYMW